MNKKIRRTLSALLIALTVALTLFSCATPAKTEEKPAVETTASARSNRPVKPEAPELPIEVTPDMEFFKDGYEIVTVAALADGDTTTFNMKSGAKTVRYLAIDTPETSNGIDPWGPAAKRFVNNLLTNAKQIVLEKDPVLTGEPGEEDGTLDKYGRLLAHVWVDGELVQWKVVEESLGRVAYLYYNYKYNDQLIDLEFYERATNPRRVNNSADKDPEYDYSDKLYEVSLEDLDYAYEGKRVKVSGIFSGRIGKNGYIQTEDGEKAVYVYTNHTKFKAMEPGNEIEVTGRFSHYNGLPEIGSLEVAPVKLSEGHEVVMHEATSEFVTDDHLSLLVHIPGLTVDSISGGNVMMHDERGNVKVYVDKYLDFHASDAFVVGSTYDITGNVSIFDDDMQLKVRSIDDIVEVK